MYSRKGESTLPVSRSVITDQSVAVCSSRRHLQTRRCLGRASQARAEAEPSFGETRNAIGSQLFRIDAALNLRMRLPVVLVL